MNVLRNVTTKKEIAKMFFSICCCIFGIVIYDIMLAIGWMFMAIGFGSNILFTIKLNFRQYSKFFRTTTIIMPSIAIVCFIVDILSYI